MKKRGMNARVQALRELSVNTQPHIDMERAKSETETYKKYGKHMITTYLEHSSLIGAIMGLTNQGFEIDFVDLDENGQVDLDHLRELIRKDTILVSIGYVDSEIGIVQPIDKIAEITKAHEHCYLHVDATQAVGKIPVQFDDVDLVTFTAHKFYGPNGIGALIKKNGIDLIDHYSWVSNLSYTYPHWLYDLLTFKIYNAHGFNGLYVTTCILAIALGLLIYFINIKLNKNHNISFLITIGSMYCLKNFIAARAQLATYLLFVLAIFFIEMFIKKKNVL